MFGKEAREFAQAMENDAAIDEARGEFRSVLRGAVERWSEATRRGLVSIAWRALGCRQVHRGGDAGGPKCRQVQQRRQPPIRVLFAQWLL